MVPHFFSLSWSWRYKGCVGKVRAAPGVAREGWAHGLQYIHTGRTMGLPLWKRYAAFHRYA